MIDKLIIMDNTKNENEKSQALKKYDNIYELHNFYHLCDGGKIIHIYNCINTRDLFFELKKNIEWEKFKYVVNDKLVESPRLMHIVNLNSDSDMSRISLFAALKELLEKEINIKFVYAVLNYYRDGKDYISYHSDREVKPGSRVVSVSLGGKRKFVLKHKSKNIKYEYILKDGDILILNDVAIKTNYKHSVPKMANAYPRINITFRE